MKFAPFKPCTLPKHVRVEILHREFPVKNLYFPCKGLQCMLYPYCGMCKKTYNMTVLTALYLKKDLTLVRGSTA